MRGRRIFFGLSVLVLAGLGVALAITRSASETAQLFVLLEFLDPAAGREAEFKTWWPSHIEQVLDTPGFIRAEPFQSAVTQLPRPSAVPLPGHLAVYFISSAEPAALESGSRAATMLSAVVNAKSARIFLYRQTGAWPSAGTQPKGDFFRQLVFGNALPARNEEFNRWYDGTHAHDLLTVPGVVAVTRFIFTSTQLGSREMPPQYLSMMDFRTASIERFGAELEQIGARFAKTDAFDVTHAWRHVYQQSGPPILANEGRR